MSGQERIEDETFVDSTTRLRNISLKSQIQQNTLIKIKLQDTKNPVNFMKKFFPNQQIIPPTILKSRILTSEDVDFKELQKLIGISERRFQVRINKLLDQPSPNRRRKIYRLRKKFTKQSSVNWDPRCIGAFPRVTIMRQMKLLAWLS